jgi:hypothetical protein
MQPSLLVRVYCSPKLPESSAGACLEHGGLPQSRSAIDGDIPKGKTDRPAGKVATLKKASLASTQRGQLDSSCR